MQHKEDLLGIFVRHKVAPNLLMIIMIIAGLLALKKLNVQFFPNFELDVISVNTVWTGASAEDVERAITRPLEQRLRNVDQLDTMTSSSAPGVSGVTLEFEENTDMVQALEQVKKEVDDFTSLPEDAELPKVAQSVRYESVARVLISGPDNLQDLRKLARRFEQELLDRGIDRVELIGLPKESIVISVPSNELLALEMNLSELATRVERESQDLPAGLAGENDGTRELRSLNQRRTTHDFESLAVMGQGLNRMTLDDIADIERRIKNGDETITVEGKKAAVLQLSRNEQGNSLKAAEILQQWYDEVVPTLPSEIHVKIFNERWQLIKGRIMLMLNNGAGGLILVLLILYAFLSTRVAFWVAVGIPISFMATLAVMYMAGGSINMVSLFALIMALGIIVDDAIVVGEDAQAHYDRGEDPLRASEGGARRMLAPVMASSMTTIAAFLPLMLVGGRMGNIMSTIPLVIISVIIASLIESFLILPGHLRHAFVEQHHRKASGIRKWLDEAFEHFRDYRFRPLMEKAIAWRGVTITLAFSVLLIAIGLFASGKVGWRFFPSPESTTVYANVRFVAGTSSTEVDRFLQHVEQKMIETVNGIDEKVVDTWYVLHASSSGVGRSLTGERNGSVYVELTESDSRFTRNNDFISEWNSKIKVPAGVESFKLESRRLGPGGDDLTLQLNGDDPRKLKQAALKLAEALKDIPGVSAIDDDLPFGYEQLIYSLTPTGEALGLSILDLGRQLRAAYDGVLLQQFQDGADEVDVRLQLPDGEKRNLINLDQLPIKLPDGRFVSLNTVTAWSSQQGFEALRHSDGRLSVNVTATVDPEENNVQLIQDQLNTTVLPQLAGEFGIDFSLEGQASSQREALGDLKLGLWLALGLIYLVLAWVFSSYGWPILVMLAIPLGLTGAVLGHFVMGMDMTMLSLFGFFGLSGIVVNDSIILVTFYQHIRREGMAIHEALVEAGCQRLRAVLLTSMTTVAGLTPLIFETSRQAQFLIPMAVSIAFGLAYATLLILLVIPAMLSIYEDVHEWLQGKRAKSAAVSAS